MTLDVDLLAVGASWAASAVGLGHAIPPVLVPRIVAQVRPMSMWYWAIVLLAKLFIDAAVWGLTRTACPPKGDR